MSQPLQRVGITLLYILDGYSHTLTVKYGKPLYELR